MNRALTDNERAICEKLLWEEAGNLSEWPASRKGLLRQLCDCLVVPAPGPIAAPKAFALRFEVDRQLSIAGAPGFLFEGRAKTEIGYVYATLMAKQGLLESFWVHAEYGKEVRELPNAADFVRTGFDENAPDFRVDDSMNSKEGW